MNTNTAGPVARAMAPTDPESTLGHAYIQVGEIRAQLCVQARNTVHAAFYAGADASLEVHAAYEEVYRALERLGHVLVQHEPTVTDIERTLEAEDMEGAE